MTSRQLLVASVILVVAVAARSPSADAVTSLPTYGTLKTRQYAGYADATADGQNRLFYWFCESDQGGDNHTIPILLVAQRWAWCLELDRPPHRKAWAADDERKWLSR